MQMRNPLALIAGAALIALAATGLLPHLLVTQALLTAILTMVIAPLCLIGRRQRPGSRPPFSASPFYAIFLVSAGTIALQLPAVVSPVSRGGLITILALTALLLGAVAFWSVVIAPRPRVAGVRAAGYVIVGGVPISMPALFLIIAPRDLYSAFHASLPAALDPHVDQMLSGFVLFTAVKVVIFIVASVIFFAAANETSASGPDQGGSAPDAGRPHLPDWARRLGPGSPAVEEPAPLREKVPV
jgi:cytochrome c oxidase assembly factor CtaG